MQAYKAHKIETPLGHMTLAAKHINVWLIVFIINSIFCQEEFTPYKSFKVKRKRNHKKPASTGGNYYIYGKHPVAAALANNRRSVHRVICLDKKEKEYQKLLTNHSSRLVDAKTMRQILGDSAVHQGIAAQVSPLPDMHFRELDLNEGKDRIAILDQISDPQNFGAIIRSAAAFGITKIIAPADGSPEENGTIAKAAAGCLELVDIARVTNLAAAMSYLKDKGFWIAGLDAGGKDTIAEMAKIDKLVIVVGSEGKGMRRLTKENCDYIVSIPIAKNVESLNAATAASIVLHGVK